MKKKSSLIRSNEREFCGELNTILNELLTSDRYPFERTTVETSLKGVKMRFPDVVVWRNREQENAAFFIEAKQPHISAVNADELSKAREKASRLGVTRFVTWNLSSGFIWEVLPEGNGQQVLASFNTSLFDINDIFAPSKRAEVRAKAEFLLQFFADIERGVDKQKAELDQTFFTGLLYNANRRLTPAITDELRKKGGKKDFRDKLQQWRREQGIEDSADNFDGMLSALSGHVAYKLLVKILFYEILRRFYSNLPALTGENAVTLENAFAKAREIDYEAIFGDASEDFTDTIELSANAQTVVSDLIDQLDMFSFRDVPLDIIGGVFEQLIDPETRHLLGQYYTNDRLEDFITSFCIRNDSDKVLDPSCGTGSFLVRAYEKLKSLKRYANPHSKTVHSENLNQLWGFDISSFAAELATLNLARLDLSDTTSYPKIRRDDFFNIDSKTVFKFPPPRRTIWNQGETLDVPVDEFDAIVGNPPYIRQELVEKSKTGYKQKLAERLAKDWKDFAINGNGIPILQLDGKADIFAYFFVHASSLLKEEGRLGFVVSRAWLDSKYGHTLQKFFLRHFKLIALVETRVEPWFIDANVDTVVVILERCSDPKKRDENVVSFVRLKQTLAQLFPHDSDNPVRWTTLEQFTFNLEDDAKKDATALKQHNSATKIPFWFESEKCFVRRFLQSQLLEKTIEATDTVRWGNYLRAPNLYFDLLLKLQPDLIPLEKVADVKRGFTTGLNQFFYINESDLDVWRIEKKYLKPLLKSHRETPTILTSKAETDKFVFYCQDDLETLRGTNALKYIKAFEEIKNADGVSFKNVPSVKNREHWYSIEKHKPADMFFPAFIGERFLIPINDKKLLADKRLYNINVKKGVEKNAVWATLSSTLTRFFLEFSGQDILGARDIDVYEAKAVLICPPERFSKQALKRIEKLIESLAERKIEELKNEATRKDRQELDEIVLESLGLNAKEILPTLYEQTQALIDARLNLTKSVKKQKSEKKERDLEKFIQAVLNDCPIDVRLKQFPSAFIMPNAKNSLLQLPEGKWHLAEMFGEVEISVDKKFWKKVPKETAAFLELAHRLGFSQITIPDSLAEQQGATERYKTRSREFLSRLRDAVFVRVNDVSFAEQIMFEICRRERIIAFDDTPF